MKYSNLKAILISVTFVSVSLLMGNAYANTSTAPLIDTYLQGKLVKVCEALQSNSRGKLLRAIKDSGVRKQAIANGLVCNGMSPTEFAMQNNSQLTAKYFDTKSYKEYMELAQQKGLNKGMTTSVE